MSSSRHHSNSNSNSGNINVALSLQNLEQVLQGSSTSNINTNNNNNNKSSHTILSELLNASGPNSPISLRLEVLRGLTHIISKYQLDMFLFSSDLTSRLWYQIRDLFDKSKQDEAKLCALHLMCAIFKVNRTNVVSMKSENQQPITRLSEDERSTGIVIDFFNVLKQVDNQMECAARLRALRLITDDGNNVMDLSPDLLIETVMQSVQGSQHTANDLSTSLSFLLNIVRRNFSSLSMNSVSKVIQFTARIMMNPRITTPFVIDILSIYEAIIHYGAIPPNDMVTFCSTMCQAVQFQQQESEEKAMDVMCILLSSPLRYRVFQVLVEIMTYSSVQSLYRGAIFYVSTIAWGQSCSDDFRDSFATVLYALLRMMSYNIDTIVYEVVRSVWRLIEKFGCDLRVEWDPIIEILEKAQLSLETGPHSSLKDTLITSLNEIQALQERGEFFGGNDDYYGLMRKYKDLCSTSVSLELLSELQKRLHPAYTNWLVDLKLMLEEYFEHEPRTEVNERVLQIVRTLLWQYSGIAENRILDVLLPFFNQIVQFNTVSIAQKTLKLVIDIARELTFSGKRYDHLAQILCKSVVDGPTEEFRLAAISGMTEAFHAKFCSLPCTEALSLYGCLLKVLNHDERSIRHKALECILSIRADRAYRLMLNDNVSPYLKCHSRNLIRTISFVLPVSNLIDSLLDRVAIEDDYSLFSRVISGIRDILLNFYLLKEPPVWRVCTTMCHIFQTRLSFILGDDCSRTETSNQKTGCAEQYIHLLTIIIGYNTDDILSLTQKQSLVDCFLFALTELYHSTYINTQLIVALLESLTICVSEMPDVMNSVFNRIIPLVSHIRNLPANQELVISALGLLHSLSTSTDKKLRHSYIFEIFDLLLYFTDNQKFTGEYIPLMTYRVLMSWFISCSFATRQDVIKTCLPVLYKRMNQNKSTLAETTIDFFVKFAYLSCDQTLQMNEQMKKIFNNGPYKAWSTGNSILTAQAGHFNYIMLRYRRPTGTIAWTMKLVNSIRNRSSDERDDSSIDESPYTNTGGTNNKKASELTKDSTLSKSRSISSDSLSQHVAESELSSLSSSAEIDSFLKSDASRSLSPTFFDHDNFMRLAQSPLPLNLNMESDDPEKNFDLTLEQFELELVHDDEELDVLDHGALTGTHSGDQEETKQEDTTDEMVLPKTESGFLNPDQASFVRIPSNDSLFAGIKQVNDDEITMQPTPRSQAIASGKPERSLITSYFNPVNPVIDDLKDSAMVHSRSYEHTIGKDSMERNAGATTRILRSNSDSTQLWKTSSTTTENPAPQKLRRSQFALKNIRSSGLGRKKSLRNIKEGLAHLKLTSFNRQSNEATKRMTSKSVYQPAIKSSSPVEAKKLSPSILNQRLFEKEGALHPNFPYLFLRNWPFLSQEEPHGLRYCDALTRALNMIDYIPSVETAKFALLYVSEGQTTEQQILKNTFGSHRYFKFLQQIGDFVSLKDQRRPSQSSNDSDEDSEGAADSASYFSEGLLYTGGLDVGPELTDGNYALIYRDDICHVVFHAATMMPNLRHDEKFSNKKRHIGNDYVTIVYSDNDKDFNPNIITGQFNVVHIVIHPLEEGFNRVCVKFRDQSMIQLPLFGPLSKPQIVSDQALSSVVRLTALHADLAARAFRKSTGEFVSNWEERMRQINMIKQRYSKPKSMDSTYMNEELNDWKLINAMNDFFD